MIVYEFDAGPVAKKPGRVPRVSRLLALAIEMEELVATGQVRDYAELARLGCVSRARVSQVLNLLCLAPDIQEAILFLPEVESGRDPVGERDLRGVCAELEWAKQRQMVPLTIRAFDDAGQFRKTSTV